MRDVQRVESIWLNQESGYRSLPSMGFVVIVLFKIMIHKPWHSCSMKIWATQCSALLLCGKKCEKSLSLWGTLATHASDKFSVCLVFFFSLIATILDRIGWNTRSNKCMYSFPDNVRIYLFRIIVEKQLSDCRVTDPECSTTLSWPMKIISYTSTHF